MPEPDLSTLEPILERYRGQSQALIPVLQEIQTACRYVPREAVPRIAEALGVFDVEVYGVLTFYRQFRLEPCGRHVLRVCQGTACHVMGSKDLFDYLQSKLGVEEGGTTDDGTFTLERVACLGCCGMAPVLAVNQRFQGECSVDQLDGVMDSCREEEA